MKANTDNSKNKNDEYTSIRVKGNTKNRVNKFLEKINKTEDCGKITFDTLISYFLENVTKDDIESLQMSAVTWIHEDKRLRRFWEKRRGKVSESKWKEMLYRGELTSFINEHSRLKIGIDG